MTETTAVTYQAAPMTQSVNANALPVLASEKGLMRVITSFQSADAIFAGVYNRCLRVQRAVLGIVLKNVRRNARSLSLSSTQEENTTRARRFGYGERNGEWFGLDTHAYTSNMIAHRCGNSGMILKIYILCIM